MSNNITPADLRKLDYANVTGPQRKIIRQAVANWEADRAALEQARALLAEQAEIITANVWHIPPEYSARNIVLDAAAKMRELAALLAAAPEGK